MEARLLNYSEQLTIEAPYGCSIQQILDANLSKDLNSHAIVFINGQMVTDHSVTLTDSDSVLITLVPQGGGGGGGKGILGAILTVVVIIAAVVLAAPTGGASLWLAGATGMSATTAGMVIGAAVSMVGMMAISALIPPPSINTGDTGSYGGITESPTYSLSGQSNSIRKYGAVAKVYGRHKVFPQLAANPLIANVGSESRISALYDFGLGNLKVEEIKIGDTAASAFDPEFHLHQDSLVKSTVFMSRKVGYDQFSYTLKQNKEIIVKTKPNTVAFDVDLTFPRGLTRFDDRGNPGGANVSIYLQYRPVGSTTWMDIDANWVKGASVSGGTPFTSTIGAVICQEGSAGTVPGDTTVLYGAGDRWTSQTISGGFDCNNGRFGDPAPGTHKACYFQATPGAMSPITISGSTAKPFVACVSIDGLAPGEYEFRADKLSGDNTDTRISSDVALTMIKSFQDGTVVNLDKKHTMLEMKIMATEKISGTVQNLSAVCTSILRTTTDGVTFTTAETRNPAWIAIDILTGEANPKPLPDSLIDWTSWIRLANFCDANGYKLDLVVDYNTTVQELLNSVLSGARSSLMLTSSGRYGVLIDEEKSIPRQLITPANSWGFSGARTFSDYPHAFRVSFINPEMNWQKDERIVYADGYNESNAIIFDDLNTFGITDKDMAWKYGRYMMAQGLHRSETFTVNMSVENLVVERGSLVHVANDVVKVGGMPCRIAMTNGNVITINTDLSVSPTGYSARQNDGTVRTGRVVRAISANEFELDDVTDIDQDCLIVLGIMDRVVQPYIVQAINPNKDLTAEISMVKYVPEVYTADTGVIPPWNPGFGDDMINSTDLKVIGLTAKQEIIHTDRLPFNKVTLDWKIDGLGFKQSEIYYSAPGIRKTYLGTTDSITEQMIIDLLKQPELVNVPVTFEVTPFSKGGIQGTSASVTITPLPDTKTPSDIEGFSVNIQDMLVEIFWDLPKDKDISHFECRYSPDPINGSWNASQLIGILPHNITKTSAGARTGKYFLQAIDTSGNRSKIAWQRTTVERLPNVNQVKVINDQPLGWTGALSDVIKLPGGNITSGGSFGSVNPVGYYFYSDFVKFDAVYEVRVRSKIVAYGSHGDDIMAKWIPMSIAKPLAKASSSQWNAQLQIRTSDASVVMANWTPLASAVPLAALSNTWSEWRNITVSDETAKVMQFRIKMESFDPNVKVVLVDGRVEIDAADWAWRENDIRIPAGGKDIVFSTAFMDIPTVAVTVDGSTTVTSHQITNKGRGGFTLKLLDAAGVSVAGQVDVAALGQGRQRATSI